MHWAIEPATSQELQEWKKYVSWFEFKIQGLAKKDRNIGKVEFGSVEVERAWTLNWCLGSPCCPNEWLLECANGHLLYICSWDFLNKWDGIDDKNLNFPGRTVTIRRWPNTHRVTAAHCSGDPLHIAEWSRELDKAVKKVLKSLQLDDWQCCHEIPESNEPHIREVLSLGGSSSQSD